MRVALKGFADWGRYRGEEQSSPEYSAGFLVCLCGEEGSDGGLRCLNHLPVEWFF